MNAGFESAWWKAQLPENWTAEEDDVCVTFRPPDSSGAVQVSAANKDNGDITDDDLTEFASERLAQRPVEHVTTPNLQGIYVEYVDGDRVWREWWLRRGHLLLYVTYNVDKQLREVDRLAVDTFVKGLQPLHT